ncbi:type II toxin-antitoxin system Phd/YefM family antitoxin [Serratia sp. M24T3]|uniref:type II toxin-antitoxin system Phd/YefM family antitoxin n=1 Tax=Serratia sp. M24T3 TaxID=932213 RepID=UPI00025B8F27|nr:type II toxin-antitoxin system Phd/YefM family antitoxin [Serratia sp. M24T3]EIC83965.1 addiction module antitoxin, Axe family protein [Serratia sp. M24T3]
MITLTYSDARAQFADVLNKAVDQPVTITRRMAPDVVVISAEQFAALQQAKFEASLAKVMNKPGNQALFKELADK